MKKNILKILFIILAIGIMAFVFANYVSAIELPSNMDEIYNPTDDLDNIGGQIIWIAQVVLYAAAVIILMVTGIKYMAAAPEAKAQLKNKMIYMVVGAVLLFAAGGIIQIVYQLAKNI